MRRGMGMFLILTAGIVVLLGVVTSVQMLGRTDWWQVLILVALVLGIGYLLLRTGRHMRVR